MYNCTASCLWIVFLTVSCSRRMVYFNSQIQVKPRFYLFGNLYFRCRSYIYVTEIYIILNVYNIQQCMFLFRTLTDQTQISYSFQRNAKNYKPFDSESHKTAGISKSICMNIYELKCNLT